MRDHRRLDDAVLQGADDFPYYVNPTVAPFPQVLLVGLSVRAVGRGESHNQRRNSLV